jgi:hypothetical protein
MVIVDRRYAIVSAASRSGNSMSRSLPMVALGERRFDERAAGIADVAQRAEADTGHRVLPYEFFFHARV